MADLTPNYDLEREAKLLKVEELKLNARRQRFRVMQLDDEKSRLETNIAATEKSIADLLKTINTPEAQADA